MSEPSIAVVSVTLNCAELLPRLIESLLAQDDQNFEWVVADGGSTDATHEALVRFPAARTTVIQGPDFGIYHALNKAVAAVRSDYYLVLGADDRLYPNAISSFRRAARGGNWDIVAASIEIGGKPRPPLRGRRWLRGGNAYVAGHAVGTLIRTELHASCGYYSNRYVNGADMHFVLTAVSRGGARVGAAPFVAGVFGDRGVSTLDRVCSISDALRIQLAFGERASLQFLIYLFRLTRALFFSRNTTP
jgi:glycosyltransferase involved in cell wall biosynthesis